MTNEMTLDDINEGIISGLTEEEKDFLEGKRAKIVNIVPIDKPSRWADKDMVVNNVKYKKSDPLPEGMTVPGRAAVIELEPILLPSGKPYVLKEDFSLKNNPLTGKWGPSLHEKGKAKMLFNKLKVNTFKECIGKEVILIKKVNDKGQAKIAIAV